MGASAATALGTAAGGAAADEAIGAGGAKQLRSAKGVGVASIGGDAHDLASMRHFAFIQKFYQSKVCDLQNIILIYKDIFGLEVPVDDPLLVRSTYPLGNLVDQ